MSAAPAQLTATSPPAPGAGHPRDDVPGGARATSWRLYVAMLLGCVAFGAVSLLYPSTPSYDPWGWLLWGREILHLRLNTLGANTFKPLPVLLTLPFALFGNAQPDLWLVVARAGAVFAVLMAFRVAWRLTTWFGATPAGRRGVARLLAYGPAILAGTVAALAMLISAQYIRDAALGYSECLGAGVVLLAIERHLDNRPRQAFVLGFIPALDRPEIWAFWGLYGVYLWSRDRGAWKLIAALFVLAPCLWFLPELWGSGHLLHGVARALEPRHNAATFAKCPFCTEMKSAWHFSLARVRAVAAVTAAGSAIAVWWALRHRSGDLRAAVREQAHRPAGVVLVLAVIAILWFVEISAMTQYGFSGNGRYLIIGGGLVVVLAGVGFGVAAWEVGRWLGRWITPAAGVGLATAAATCVFLFVPHWFGSRFSIGKLNQALRYQAELREDVSTIIQRAGGAKKVRACGTVKTESFQKQMVAWYLGVYADQVQASDAQLRANVPASKEPNVILQTRDTGTAHLRPFIPTNVRYTQLRQRTFTLYEHCK